MKTAEEFFNEWVEISEDVFEYKLCMIEFAKMHVKEALKQASEKAETIYIEPDGCATGDYYDIDKKTILNAYTIEKIK